MTVISAFTALFSLIFVMTGGGPGYGTTTLEFFVYQTAFAKGAFGTGALLGIILFVIMACYRPGAAQAAALGRLSEMPVTTSRRRAIGGLSTRSRRRIRPGRILLFALMIMVAIVMFYPFWFMISASFKTQDQFMAGSGFSLESWKKLADTCCLWASRLLNSLIVCTLSIAIIVVVSTMAGFAFAKLRYRAVDRRLPAHHRRDADPDAVDHHPGLRQHLEGSTCSRPTSARSSSMRPSARHSRRS